MPVRLTPDFVATPLTVLAVPTEVPLTLNVMTFPLPPTLRVATRVVVLPYVPLAVATDKLVSVPPW